MLKESSLATEMMSTGYNSIQSFVTRTAIMLIIIACFVYSPLQADTVVTPATGGANLCVGDDFVTLGDIVVQEGTSTDFRSDLHKEFVLIVNSADFRFEPGVGTVSVTSGSSTVVDPLAPIVVTSNSITINFAIVGADATIDGFTISGIRVRATGAATSAGIFRQSPANTTEVDFIKNQPVDNVNHGTLSSSTPPTLVLASNDADNTICTGETITFVATSLAATYYEFFVDGISRQNGISNTYAAASLVNGQVVTAKSRLANGCTSASSNTIAVTVHTLPTLTLSSNDADNTICQGQSVTFTASPTGLSSYEFYVNNTLVQPGNSHQYTTSDLTNGQTVMVKATTSNGCMVSSTAMRTTVYPVPTLTLASSDADNTICAGEVITFTAASSIPAIYEFFVDGNPVQSGASNSFTSSAITQGQRVYVEATTATGCTAQSAELIISVQPVPARPDILITSGQATFCEQNGNSVTLQSSAGTGNQWFKDGVLLPGETGQTITVSNSSQSGNYSVVASGPAPANCKSAASEAVKITIYQTPDASLPLSYTPSVCADAPATISVIGTQPGINYTLYSGSTLLSGPNGGTGGTISLSTGLLPVGNHTLTIKATNPVSLCSTDLAAKVHLTVNEKPTIILTSSDADNKICAGEPLTFTASFISEATYHFMINGVSAQNGSSPQFTTNSLLDGQTVSVQVTTSAGCTNTSNGITTRVYSLPVVILSSSDADNVACEGETVIYTAASSTATTYEFYLNNISLQKGSSNICTLSNVSSNHSVRVEVTTANGCTATSNVINTTVSPTVWVEAGPDQTICEGSPITLNASVNKPGTATTWSGGLGSYSNSHSLTTQYSPAASEIGKTITLILTTDDPDGTGPCTAVSNQVRITIYALPTVLMSGLNSQYCIDAPEVHLTGFPLGGNFTGPGIIYNGITSDYVFKASEAGPGIHTIRYTFTDNNSCTNYIEKAVTVHTLPTVSFNGFNTIGLGGTPLYPQNAPLVNLTGSPAGGIFTGAGISGNSFSPSAAGPGTFTVRYTYQDTNGCTNYQEQAVTVVALPAIGINDTPSPFCSKDPDFILTGSPAGGVFSGPGIISSTSIFRPSSAFIGANVIRYTYTDPATRGVVFVEKTIIVNKVPDVTFSGLNEAYCTDVIMVPLSGFPADTDGPGGVSGVFKGAGIYPGSTYGTYYFNPSAAGAGMHTVTYVYSNENGCLDSTSKTVIVHELPQVTFSGLDEAYCIDAPEVGLSGFPSGGTFNGPGISGNTFFPALAGIGTHSITYAYTNNNGCSNTQTRIVKVYPVPQANFSFSNICDNDHVQFTDLTDQSQMSGIKTWEWNFGDRLSAELNTSWAQHPTHQFTAPGTYTVTLKVTSLNGCESIKTFPVTIGGLPKPDFTWNSICLGNGTLFTHSTLVEPGTVTSWEWNFGDGQRAIYSDGSKQVAHIYSAPGKYRVTLKVTSNFACAATVTKELYILPAVSAFPYLQNFDAGTGGWTADGIRSSWEHGTPAGNTINNAASGQNAWITGLSTVYNANEKSYVYSPCFDFSGLNKPMIALKIWSHTQQGFDGAVLQSSTNGGATWENVGNVGEGINWYNQSAIIGNPGNQVIGQNGWSGTDNNWREAKFALDYLTGKPSVRFRVAFGSNSDNPPDQILDGFAFDDVFIGERDRTVLLEHFTNTSNPEANQENIFIDQLSLGNDEVISIGYHTNFPGNDPMNASNWADPSARALYYGVPQTPRTAIDGYIENQKFSAWGTPVLSRRKLKETAFAIDIDFPQTTDNQLNISARITSHFENSDTLVVHIAVVEKQVAGLYESAPVFTNVLRKMLPHAAGTRFTQLWKPGETETIEQSWVVNNVVDASQLAVIVFIQNERTKEVYQAQIKQPSSPPSLITGLSTSFIENQTVTLYPNPASGQAQILVGAPLLQTYFWTLYDFLGRKVEEGSIQKGETHTSIQVSSLPEGTYLLHITGANKTSVYKKLIVLHSN